MSGSTYSNRASLCENGNIGGRDAHFQCYPQLKRLCDDFGLQVSQASREGQAVRRVSFGLVERHLHTERYLTPLFPSMSQLEAFVADNLVDILHDYFFGEQQGVSV